MSEIYVTQQFPFLETCNENKLQKTFWKQIIIFFNI